MKHVVIRSMRPALAQRMHDLIRTRYLVNQEITSGHHHRTGHRVPASLFLSRTDGMNLFVFPQALQDAGRIQQLQTYLENMRQAIVADGVDVQGYFHWYAAVQLCFSCFLFDHFEIVESFFVCYVCPTCRQSHRNEVQYLADGKLRACCAFMCFQMHS